MTYFPYIPTFIWKIYRLNLHQVTARVFIWTTDFYRNILKKCLDILEEILDTLDKMLDNLDEFLDIPDETLDNSYLRYTLSTGPFTKKMG